LQFNCILVAMARGVMRGLGIVLLVAGLGLLGWVGWQNLGTGITANQKMGEAENALRDQWKKPAPATTVPTTGSTPRTDQSPSGTW
jgi:sortase A